MQDELFMRQWNDVHQDFTADLHQTLKGLGRYQRKRQGVIGSAYGKPALSPAARASLRGLAASVITFGLWVTVMMLATPAPGLASPLEAATASACVAAPVLA